MTDRLRPAIFAIEPIDPIPFVLPLFCECCKQGRAAAACWWHPRAYFLCCYLCAASISGQELLEIAFRAVAMRKGLT